MHHPHFTLLPKVSFKGFGALFTESSSSRSFRIDRWPGGEREFFSNNFAAAIDRKIFHNHCLGFDFYFCAKYTTLSLLYNNTHLYFCTEPILLKVDCYCKNHTSVSSLRFCSSCVSSCRLLRRHFQKLSGDANSNSAAMALVAAPCRICSMT